MDEKYKINGLEQSTETHEYNQNGTNSDYNDSVGNGLIVSNTPRQTTVSTGVNTTSFR